MSCPDCFTGTLHERTPKGSTTVVHGRNTYVAYQPTPLAAKPIIVIITDAFGWTFVNNRVMADDIARKGGFQVLMPDFMDGREAPLWLLDVFPKLSNTGLVANIQKPYYGLRAAAVFIPFLYANRFSVAWPKMIAFLTDLRANTDNSIPIGVAGYCWGGKHAITLAHGTTTLPDSTRTIVDCAFVAHPSGLDFPSDIEKISLPFSLAIGDKDIVMGPKMVEESREILEKKTGRVHSEVVVYAGAKHGFAVRGDPESESEVEQEGQAQDQAVRWFRRWLAEGKQEV